MVYIWCGIYDTYYTYPSIHSKTSQSPNPEPQISPSPLSPFQPPKQDYIQATQENKKKQKQIKT